MMAKSISTFIDRYRVSVLGLSLGLLFFAASLTPSLIPRPILMQGALGGFLMALGYLIGAILIGIWRFLGIPEAKGGGRAAVSLLIVLVSLAVLTMALVASRHDQNDVRGLMNMELLEDSHTVTVLGIAIGLSSLLFLLGRLLAITTRWIKCRMPARLPPRIAIVLSLALVALISWNIANGVIARGALNAADRSLQELDALIDPALPVPTDPLRSGSAASLMPWWTLGAQGRAFVAGGATAEEISDFHGGNPVKNPIRVYAGLNSAADVDARAALVLEEMKRVGAFDRAYLILATPTGRGWIDPAAVDPLEIIHRGDTAIVGMQYSYLMSPLAVLVEPDLAPESAAAVARLVHDHWVQLTPKTRPKLFLHGLSLGSYGSEQALSPLKLIDNPIDGALWSGPTFNNTLWQTLTRSRNPDTPAWLPRVGNGEVVRFTSQENTLVRTGETWGRSRFVYLQYASDPITFFEIASAFRSPEWMVGQRGPDVSGRFRWYPLITMFQLAVDMAISTNVPEGFGHFFAAEHYIDAWLALTDPADWQDEETERLKERFL
jgi:uncharacterized membrane protein